RHVGTVSPTVRAFGVPSAGIPAIPCAGDTDPSQPGGQRAQAALIGWVDRVVPASLFSVWFFSSSRRRHTRCYRDWSSDVCSSDLFAVIKDVPKTLVYELARWRNGREADPVIPKRVFTRPPTAELRPNQTDQDSLPPYEVLDPIIRGYVEEDQSLADLVAAGFDGRTVEHVIALV